MSAGRPAGELPPVGLVSDPNRAPYPSICSLTVVRRRALVFTGTYNSSGALLDPGHILTAAHNLHGTPFTRVQSADTECGVDSRASWPLSNAFGQGAFVVAAGYSWFEFPLDYGLVWLSAEAPRPSQFRLPAAGQSVVAVGSTVHVAGFPTEEPFLKGRLYSGSGAVTEVTETTFSYAIDTGGGMSGSPVWVERCAGGACEYIVVGVHVGFADGAAVARRVDERTLLDDLGAWIRRGPTAL